MPNNQPVGVMSIVLQLNSASYSEAIREAQRKLDAMAGKARTAGTTTVSSMRAASAAIRELNGDFTNNIRAVEAFISSTLGAGPVLQKIFPVVGGAAFVAVLAEMGTKMYDFVRTANRMPETIRDGFASLNLDQKTGIDSLNVMTDKLNEAHALFEHQPGNALKTAIDEARKSADDFTKSVIEANKGVADLLDKNHLNPFLSFLMAKPLTGGVEKDFDAYRRKQAHNAYEFNNAAPGSDEQKAAQQAINDTLNGFIRDQQGRLPFRQAQGGGVAADAEGLLSSLLNEKARQQAQVANAAAEGQQAKDEAAKKALAAAKEADAQRFAAMKQALENQKLMHGATLADEQDFWQKMYATTSAKKDPGLLALVAPELVRAQDALAKELRKGWDEAAKAAEDGHKQFEDVWKEIGKQADEQVRATYATIGEGMRSDLDARYEKLVGADKARELGLRDAPAGEAARQIAAMHENEYQLRRNDPKEGLGAQLDQAKTYRDMPITGKTDAEASLERAERQRNVDAIRREINELDRQHDLQQAEDDARIRSTTLLGGMSDALTDFVRSATDAGAALRGLFTGGLDATNNAIVRTLTTPASQRRGQHVFGQVGHEVFTSATGALLKSAEGSALKALGIGGGGKADGSKSSPWYVRMADAAGADAKGAAKGVEGALGGLLHKLHIGAGGDPSMVDSDIAEAMGGGLGGMLGKLGGLGGILGKLGGLFGGGGGGAFSSILSSAAGMIIPGFAAGVDDFAGGLAMVGERGPELVQLPPHSNVVPNGAIGGGDTHHVENHLHLHGDNWNENDVDKRIEKKLRAAGPQIAGMTIKAIDERKARSVPGRY